MTNDMAVDFLVSHKDKITQIIIDFDDNGMLMDVRFCFAEGASQWHTDDIPDVETFRKLEQIELDLLELFSQKY